MSNPQQVVETAPIQPPSVSLINAAITVKETDARWEMGFQYVPEGCGAAEVYDVCNNDPTTGFQNAATTGAPPITGTPFGIIASDTCSTFSYQTRDFRARAERMLKAVESFKIARQLWEAEVAVPSNPYLMQPGLSTTVTTGAKPRAVIGQLEEAFYATSPAQRAMIHMSPDMLERLMFDSGGAGLRREGNVFYTWMDSVVAVDKGYRGKGPGGAAGEWLYITPIVSIRLGPIRVTPDTMSEAVLRRQNEVTFYAGRTAQATWDYNCQTYTLSVDLT